MKIKIFTNKSFLGEFSLDSIFGENSLVSAGSIVRLNEKQYCVDNVTLKKDQTIKLDVH
ncbi:hypothetical protein [Brevibacillus laterosporus]|uniref:hypothetical protein n=1 Tax=Brevibacillus laterosporus TaxID=1465 RepID=UPI001EF2EDA6|nr:hypothetical protein [Brevibacillus laterosporus]MCG7318022.1 hypothetical protein [Brevibacillus laterosporus]